jgi:hypothetical protein
LTQVERERTTADRRPGAPQRREALDRQRRHDHDRDQVEHAETGDVADTGQDQRSARCRHVEHRPRSIAAASTPLETLAAEVGRGIKGE